MLPHLLHYIALLGGTALVSAAGGSALFFVVGLAFSLPMLRRLYRRFHSWVAPAIVLSANTPAGGGGRAMQRIDVPTTPLEHELAGWCWSFAMAEDPAAPAARR